MNRLTLWRRLAAAWFADRRQFRFAGLPRTCPICGYHGMFINVGHPPRWAARCLNCGSRERHRLLHLWVTQDGGDLVGLSEHQLELLVTLTDGVGETGDAVQSLTEVR